MSRALTRLFPVAATWAVVLVLGSSNGQSAGP